MQKRQRIKQVLSLEGRLAAEANRLREQALALPPGPEQEAVLKKARQADVGSHMTDWLRSPGLRAPN